MPRTVPLFPLNTVLFPGMALPLRIFEPRYQLMVERCLEGQHLIGIALILEGDEVGDPAVPYAVGTLAAIQSYEPHENGEMDIVVVGVSRYRLVDPVEGEPYLQGDVELIDERHDENPQEALKEVQALFDAYLQALAEASDQELMAPPMGDPIQLSYCVASVLQIPLEEKQRLLEIPGSGDRLDAEAVLLRREIDRIRAFSTEMRRHGYFYHRGTRYSTN